MEKLSNKEFSMEDKNPEKVFVDYVRNLELSEGDLKKNILDVGSGEGLFAEYVKARGINPQIVNLELNIDLPQKNQTVQGSVESIPFADESFELVISHCSIPNIFLGEDDPEIMKEKISKSLSEMVRVIKNGGEVRLGPVGKGDTYQSQRNFVEALEHALLELKKDYGVMIEEIYQPENNIYEYVEEEPDKNRLLSKSFLLKIHKPQNNNE